MTEPKRPDASGRQRRGRATKPVDPDLPEEVRVWVQTLRDFVIFPLRDHGWPLGRLAEELGDLVRVPGDGQTSDGKPSGASKTTLQRFVTGTRIPDRDVVQHLLDLAAKLLPDPPGRAERERLWDCYAAALAKKNPDLHRFYTSLTARDEALARAVRAETRNAQLAADLGRAQRRMGRVDSRLAYARMALRLQGEAAARRLKQVQDGSRALQVQLHGQIDDLTREKQGLQREVDALRGDMDRAAADAAERIAELVQGKESVEGELAALREQLAHDRARQEEESAAGEITRREHQAARAELDLLNHRVRDLEEQHAAAARRVDDLRGQMEAAAGDLAQARRDLLERDGQLARLLEELGAARVQQENEQDALSQADDALTLALQTMQSEYDRRPEPPPALVPTPETTALTSSPPSGSQSSAATSASGTPREAPAAPLLPRSEQSPTATGGFSDRYSTTSQMRVALATADHHKSRGGPRRMPRWLRDMLLKFSGLLMLLGVFAIIGSLIFWGNSWKGPLTFKEGDRPKILKAASIYGRISPGDFAWNLGPSRQVTASFTDLGTYADYDDLSAGIEQTSTKACPGSTVQWDVHSSGSPVASGVLTGQQPRHRLKKHAAAFPHTVTLTLRRTDNAPCTVQVRWNEPYFYKPALEL